MEEENKVDVDTVSSNDKRRELLIGLNTNENKEVVKNKIEVIFEKLNILDTNHHKILENFEFIREEHFIIYEEYSKLNLQNTLLNPIKKTGLSNADKNVKSDRNLNKLHSTVKKKEININNLSRLDSLSVSSAKHNKSIKSVDISVNNLNTKNNRPDSHSVKGPDIRSKLMKKEIKTKEPNETHLQTEANQQEVKKKPNKGYNLTPSKSQIKTPIMKDDSSKQKKTITDFKKNSTSKDIKMSMDFADKENAKDPKKSKDQKNGKEKIVNNSANKKDNSKNEKVSKNGENKNLTNGFNKNIKKKDDTKKEEKQEEPNQITVLSNEPNPENQSKTEDQDKLTNGTNAKDNLDNIPQSNLTNINPIEKSETDNIVGETVNIQQDIKAEL